MKNKPNMTYDTLADAAYLSIKGGQVAFSKRLSDDLIVDIGKRGEIIGIEILGLSRSFSKLLIKKLKKEKSLPFLVA